MRLLRRPDSYRDAPRNDYPRKISPCTASSSGNCKCSFQPLPRQLFIEKIKYLREITEIK